MKKFFKWLLIIVVVLIAIFLILGLIVAKDYRIERSVTINAPYEIVYSSVNTLESMNRWSPWVDYDPNMKITYEGEDGKIGAKYSWEGNDDVGKGYQELTEITENRISSQVHFLEPMESEATAIINLEQTDDGIKVTWGFEGSTAYPMNLMHLFMNMDEMLGKDFATGLHKLDSVVSLKLKAEPKKYRGYSITEIEYGPKTFVGFRETLNFNDMPDFYKKHYGRLFEFYTSKNIEFDGYPSGMYYSYNMETNEADMMAAIPVKEENPVLPEGYQIVIAKGKALFIEYKGSYEGSGNAHWAMDDYMKEKGMELNELVIEEYVTDPAMEPDTSAWITNIIYLVK